MTRKNDTTPFAPGSRPNYLGYSQSTCLDNVLPPGRDHLEAIVLAAALFCPDVLEPHLHRLTHSLMTNPIWHSMARIALHQIRGTGMTDVESIERVLSQTGLWPPESIAIEVTCLHLIAPLATPERIAQAVAGLRRRPAA